MCAQIFQQKRAAYALRNVRTCRDNPACDNKKFKSRASELPFMIHANGLGQALAFFKSKGDKDGHKFLYDILSEWLCSGNGPYNDLKHNEDALDGVTKRDSHAYKAAQAESIMLMDWIKKFASSEMSEDPNNQNNGQGNAGREEAGGGHV